MKKRGQTYSRDLSVLQTKKIIIDVRLDAYLETVLDYLFSCVPREICLLAPKSTYKLLKFALWQHVTFYLVSVSPFLEYFPPSLSTLLIVWLIACGNFGTFLERFLSRTRLVAEVARSFRPEAQRPGWPTGTYLYVVTDGKTGAQEPILARRFYIMK